MLELKNIKKSYIVGKNEIEALKDVSISFANNEFVSIIGPSGCGKTTLLNIIGALDHQDAGSIKIDNIDTSSYKNSDWDRYRNEKIGFVFQSYNLIPHLTVFQNVELALKISGLSTEESRQIVNDTLKKVGMADLGYKKPLQLSGGQMQRVAIARAIINNPEVVLADEPTGALDSETSEQIIGLLKELSKEVLIVMVTHNEAIAKKYSNRIISMLDGLIVKEEILEEQLVKDASQDESKKDEAKSKAKRVKLGIFSAFFLSFKNLISKKYRTFLTAFACSIGIIGIALVLAVSNGFNIFLSGIEQTALTSMPITVRNFYVDIDELAKQFVATKDKEAFPDSDELNVIPNTALEQYIALTDTKNKITQEYIDYLQKAPKEYVNDIIYFYGIDMKILTKSDDGIIRQYRTSHPIKSQVKDNNNTDIIKSFDLDTWDFAWQEISSNEDMIVGTNGQYKVLEGRYPKAMNEVIIISNAYNEISKTLLNSLGLEVKEGDKVKFKDLIGRKLSYIPNNNFYTKDGGLFVAPDLETAEGQTQANQILSKADNLEIEIVGVMRLKDAKSISMYGNGIGHTEALSEYAISNAKQSEVYKAQELNSTAYVTKRAGGQEFEPNTNEHEIVLRRLGGGKAPSFINIYPKNIENRDKLLVYLDKFNENKPKDEQVRYMDLTKISTKAVANILEYTQIALIVFASISLIVSSIMISLITYVSVLERRKEIGILRSIGARRFDIANLFNAENVMIGLNSGLMGMFFAFIFGQGINVLVRKLSKGILEAISVVAWWHFFMLVSLSIILSVIAGLIPAVIGAYKDPVEALRDE